MSDTCGICEQPFDVADARADYNAEWEGADYDDEIEGGLCGGCAISKSSSELAHGQAIQMMNGEIDYDDDHVTEWL